jgi:hypothetical protein
MVKIPGLDDLKKMGTGLIDSAKSVKFGDMVDKLKTGIESARSGGGNIPQGDEALKSLFQGLNASMGEILEMQAAQVTAIKKLQSQLSDLGRAISANQKAETPENNQPEDPKSG